MYAGYVSQSAIDNQETLHKELFLEHTGPISFTTYDANTLQPIQDVNVLLNYYSGQNPYEVGSLLSDSDGLVSFGDQIYGHYGVQAVHPNYEMFSMDFNHPVTPYGTDLNILIEPI